jgi:protein SCO1
LADDLSEDTGTGSAPAGDTHDPPQQERPWIRDWRLLTPIGLILVVAAVAALLVSGTSNPSQALPNNVQQSKQANFDGLTATPLKPAPPLRLRSYLGQPVNIASYRGKAVLVTFLYANCPTLCPLIAANLHTAQARMTAAERARVQIIAVSVDPRHDTRQAVAKFLRQHRMTGRMQYLVGDAQQLGRVWAAWNVGSQRDAQNPDVINHSGLVFGIGASGKLVTVYPGNFSPPMIVHDIPGLLAS